MRVGVIGTGFMGRVHVEAIRRLGFVEIGAVVGSRIERARMLADSFGIERAEADFRKILDDTSIDAVHICTPNALHYPIAEAALSAGKHVLCEKPLAMSSQEATKLVQLAGERKRRNCTCHNLRYYPMVQQMRAMRQDGELGDILVAQGTYSQDWLLYDTDWNWRIDAKDAGPLRTMGDIGSHWCDMVEHVTGQQITSLSADLTTFHKTRKRPTAAVETFAGKNARPDEAVAVSVETEDFGAVLFHMTNGTRGAFTASQVSAGCKNRLSMEMFGTKASVAWNQERPNELWVGRRDTNNEIIVKDPALLRPTAQSFAELPGGHAEGYADTFKQVFRRFYQSILEPTAEPEYPQFVDGLRQLRIIESELSSDRKRSWVDVPQ